jgi:hypothetical protein
MAETEAERQVRELGQKIEQVRQEMDARGIGLPPLLDALPERVN